MPVTGKMYSAGGLMVYGLAYGTDAEARLVELIAGPLRKVLTEPPARLKPLDQDSVLFVPGVVNSNAPTTKVYLAKDGRTIVVDVEVSTRQPSVEFTARVENTFYPYVITRATVVAQFAGRGWADSLRVTPSTLSALEPGLARELSVVLPIPLAQIPSLWSLTSLSSMGTQVSIPGAIELALTDQHLRVADTFRARLAEIFPGDPLSEVFTPSEAVRSSKVSIPVLIRVGYPLYPLILSGLAGLAILALVGGLLVFLSGERRFDSSSMDGRAASRSRHSRPHKYVRRRTNSSGRSSAAWVGPPCPRWHWATPSPSRPSRSEITTSWQTNRKHPASSCRTPSTTPPSPGSITQSSGTTVPSVPPFLR